MNCTNHAFHAGDKAIVKAAHAASMTYNVGGQGRKLRPGDVVTITGRFPEDDDGPELGTDGLAYTFTHPDLPTPPDSGDFTLYGIMIEPIRLDGTTGGPTVATSRPPTLDALADAWIADIGNHVAREAFHDALVAAGKVGGMTSDGWFEHGSGAKFWAYVRSGEWWTIAVA